MDGLVSMMSMEHGMWSITISEIGRMAEDAAT